MRFREIRKTILLIVTFLVFIGIFSIQEAQAYSKSKSITIQSGQVISGPYTNFPMLFSVTDLDLRTKANGGDVENSNGYDIIFKDSNGVQLDHEVESYNGTTGTLVAWVEVPSIDNGTVIYIYYGNSTITSPTENPTGVWNSNYLMVHHLKEASGILYDSTSNNNDSNNAAGMTYEQTGQIGYSLLFDEVDDYYTIADFSYGNTFTVSMWVKVTDNAGTAYQYFYSHDTLSTNPSLNIFFNEDGATNPDDLMVRMRDDVASTEDMTDDVSAGDINATDGSWHYVTVTRVQNGTNNIYIDGASQATSTGANTAINPAGNINIGRREDGSSTRYFGGNLDEIRISNTERSAGWIQTEYNNQYAPSSFYSVGTETSCSFSYRKSITVNSGQVSSGPHSNFPLLVSLTDNDLRTTANGGDVTSSSGYDIIFRAVDDTTCNVAGGGTNPCTLDHEIEFYDGTPDDVTLSGGWYTGTGSYTVPAGRNRLLVFVSGFENNADRDITNVTFGGVSMTEAIGDVVTSSGYYARTEIWYLKNASIPASGSFVVTYSGGAPTDPMHAYALFTNVDQTTPVEDTASNPTTTLDPVTATVNVVQGGMSVAGATCGNTGSYTWGNGWTEGTDQTSGATTTMSTAYHANSASGTDTASADHSSTINRQVLVVASLRPSPGGEFVAWVRVPSITNGTVIYIYYGNGCITSSTENPTGVWDSNYKGVWHLKETPTVDSNAYDSTANNNDGTFQGSMTSGDQVAGKIDGSLDFDGTDDYISTANSSSGPQNFTIEAWFRTSNASGTKIFGFEDTQTGTASTSWDRHFYMGTDGYVRFGCYDGTTDVATSTTTLNNNAWHHVVGVREDSTDELRIYVDGTWNNTVSNANAEVFTGYWRIGSYKTTGWTNGVDGYFGSMVDEVRVSTTVRSAGWIQTEYNNQNAPSSFYALGSEENGPLAIELMSFTAKGNGGSVKVEWETKTEIDNVGFNLYQSTERNGTYTKLNNVLIPGLLSSVVGHKYSYIDTDVIKGKLYYYKLEDIDLNGTKTMHGPICVDWDADGIPDDEDSDVKITDSVSGQTALGSNRDIAGNGGGVVTQVELQWLRAHRTKDGVMIEWQTGYEVDNLGFNVYREEDGEIYRLTPELIAGSALLAGSGVPLTAGRHYIWWDTSISNQTSDIRYWVEDIDLNGERTMHGPVKVKQSAISDQQSAHKGQSDFLNDLGMKLEERYREYWKAQEVREKIGKSLRRTRSLSRSFNRGTRSFGHSERAGGSSFTIAPVIKVEQPTERDQAMQRILSGTAVKALVKEEGWYRVTQPELVAAGLNPSINPRYLRLFVDGREQPLYVSGETDRRFDSGDVVEFYGTGLDTPSTDTKVYWLIVDSKPGKRVQVYKSQGGRSGASSFPYMVQKKDRTVYFAALKNGDEENFFGPIISTQKVDQLLNVMHPDLMFSGDALLEVALQGATNVPHRVKVYLNEDEVGEVVFDNQTQGTSAFSIPQTSLIEGENLVSLVAEGGNMDISLIDYIRLTYWHRNTADDGILKLTAEGGKEISVDGFSSPDIRVIDITNTRDILEVTGKVRPQGSGYSITFRVPSSGQRTLLTFTEGKLKNHAGISANKTSSWYQKRNGYDYVIITHRDFLESLRPLKRLRESQGLSVALVDVEDVYDEFSFGEKNPQALKDFLSFTRQKWSKAPRFVFLVGDASFDPRNYLGFGDFDFVPTKLVDTAYLETASDDWFADTDGDGLPDIAIGRMPVHSDEEAGAVVSKLIGYEKANPIKEALFVADKQGKGDVFNFEAGSRDLQALLPPSVGVREIFRNNFSSDDKAKSELLSSLDQGPLLVNYIGHGSVGIWRGSILSSSDADSLINGKRLILFMNMTCLNGFFHAPYADSLAEALLKAGQGGAIAVWASSGLTFPDKQAIMNKELIQLLFNGKSLTIGEAVMKAKAATPSEDVRKTWIFFGDPATRLRY